jgi:hypothetical protein
MVQRRRLVRCVVATCAVLVLVLAGCTGGGDGALAWRDARFELPEGWQEIERRDDLLMVADGPPAEEPGQPGTLEVAMQVTVDADAGIAQWRDFVTEQGGAIESEVDVELGTVPATALQFSLVTNGIPTRERVVVVPSRDLVMLQQPVPVAGQTDGPEVFLDRVDEFDAILDTFEFGAPEDYLDR